MLGIEVNDSRDHRFLVAGCSGKIDWLSGQAPMNLASRSDGLGRDAFGERFGETLVEPCRTFFLLEIFASPAAHRRFHSSAGFFGRDSSSDFYDRRWPLVRFLLFPLSDTGKQFLLGTQSIGMTLFLTE